jgi:uncharacterized protein YndB with AHSA1/START domain
MLGRLDRTGDRLRLEFTRTLAHPPEKVWRSLTEPEHLAAWFPAAIHGEWTAGAPLRFEFEHGEGPTLDGEVLACDPPSLLEYRWGEETMRFELEPSGGGTVLRFVNTFDDLGKAARDAAGWHACLDLLGHDVAGDQPPWGPEERWAEVHPAYVEALGPEAATVGPPG